jgi:hypothetical protein
VAAFDDHVFVVTTDPANNTGSCAAFDIESPWAGATNLEPTGPWAIVRHFFGLHYVVHRSTGMIQVIDPENFTTRLHFSVGAGSNPHDIMVVDRRTAYVSRHASYLLYEVDPSTGELRSTINLSMFADEDGIPEMSMMARDGHHLFVQIQRIGPGLASASPAYLAVIDIRTNQLVDADPGLPGVQGIMLTGPVPSFKMEIDESLRRLYVSEPGEHHDSAGGIDEIDLDTLTALGFLPSEVQIPLNITGFTLVSPVKGYVIAHTDIALSSHLQPYSRIDGSAMGDQVYATLTQVDSVAHDPVTDQIFFPDPRLDGVMVFDATDQKQLSPGPVNTGPDPSDLIVCRATTPGEATELRVESFDAATGDMQIGFRTGCGASDHSVVFGPLEDIGSYGYSGRVCDVGSRGRVQHLNPGPDSYFFMIVGNDGDTIEGSYGRDGEQQERPPYSGDPPCDFTQDLSLRCD